MDTELKLTQVTDEDIAFLEQELSGSSRAFALRELTEKLAFQKTASQRTQDIKVYDPNCVYEVGDQIYKEYNEQLTVSSKTIEPFHGAVVLTVVHKTPYPMYNCDMLEVDYAGGGTFRRYVDYMKKIRTQVLLPSNQGVQNLAPRILDRAQDPRLSELPMTDKDIKALERDLRAVLLKHARFFSWNDYWQLTAKRVDIPDEKVKEAEQAVAEAAVSMTAEAIVQKLYGLEPSSDVFDLHCLSLNSTLDKKFRKEFVLVLPQGWGKWHLKKLLAAMPENLPVAAAMAKVPDVGDVEPRESAAATAFPAKLYLTWREVLSGAIKIPKSLAKELSHSREYVFTDPEEGKTYAVYYFPNYSYILGLGEYYAHLNITQGASLTLEKKGPALFHFWVKKSKKKIAVPKLLYDPKSDTFSDSGEESFTFVEPNKMIFLEKDLLRTAFGLYEQRQGKDLLELLVMVFTRFSGEAGAPSLHYLRAYHLLDLLKQTTPEDVERMLLASPRFITSEKKKGIFFYEEPERVKAEILAGVTARVHAAAVEAVEGAEELVEGEELPIGMIEEEYRGRVPEVEEPEAPLEIISLEPKPRPVPVEVAAAQEAQVEAELAAKPKAKVGEAPAAKKEKEKPAKKKKVKVEGEKVTRGRKSERRVIEEKIALEEGEIEALEAIKAEKERMEAEEAARAEAKEKKEEAKPEAAATFGSLFAEKLKFALKKKPEDKDQEEKTAADRAGESEKAEKAQKSEKVEKPQKVEKTGKSEKT